GGGVVAADLHERRRPLRRPGARGAEAPARARARRARRDRHPVWGCALAHRRWAGWAQWLEVAQTRARGPRLRARARRHRTPGLQRSGGRLRIRPRTLPRGPRPGARPRGARRRGGAAHRARRGTGLAPMALRSLLGLSEEDPAASVLAREGGHAFVSASLRPYAIAALADRQPDAQALRPTLVVVGDDRAARDLAGDLQAWLAPRRVRYYPSRGVAYESHLAPPPPLVGLRVAPLDALLTASDAAGDPPVVVVSAVALSEKVPDPAL